MGVVDDSQRPVKQRIQELQRRRISQLTIKIKPYTHRPNLLGEVPQANTIGVGQGGKGITDYGYVAGLAADHVRKGEYEIAAKGVGRTLKHDYDYYKKMNPTVRLAGGDLPVGDTYETEWYYPTSRAFSENAVQAGLAGEDAVKSNVQDRDDDRCGF